MPWLGRDGGENPFIFFFCPLALPTSLPLSLSLSHARESHFADLLWGGTGASYTIAVNTVVFLSAIFSTW